MEREFAEKSPQQPPITSIKVIKTDYYLCLKQIDIIVYTEKSTLDLGSLLPENWEIWETKSRLHTDPDRKRIVIPEDYFKAPGNVFSFLHEAGHALSDESKNDGEIEEDILLRDKYNHLGSNAFTIQEKSRFQVLVIKSEKKAWDWALKTISEYRKRGIDLEPSLSGNDLEKLAKQKVKSYEN